MEIIDKQERKCHFLDAQHMLRSIFKILVLQAHDAAPGTFKTLKIYIQICNYADTASQI